MLSKIEHHAYGIAGKKEIILPALTEDLKKIGVKAAANPDFHIEHFDAMGIENVRTLKTSAEKTPVAGGIKLFIVIFEAITIEAQNALLKIFEDPPPRTYFFLIIPSFDLLIGTLQSRIGKIAAVSSMAATSERAKTFLSGGISVRIKMVQQILKNKDSAKIDAVSFLDELEVAAGKYKNTSPDSIAEILEFKKYARDRSASMKLLLEHLALVLPLINANTAK